MTSKCSVSSGSKYSNLGGSCLKTPSAQSAAFIPLIPLTSPIAFCKEPGNGKASAWLVEEAKPSVPAPPWTTWSEAPASALASLEGLCMSLFDTFLSIALPPLPPPLLLPPALESPPLTLASVVTSAFSSVTFSSAALPSVACAVAAIALAFALRAAALTL
eukprot:CAMPEP_0119468318 /NCGR_PEP_ID=MMETSP1344-20130328/2122_1 /TAXON_ID=236787 /ORGANISM="Florenciella parvula, Strain CCMP2471" /LENGTH=160 /DNA_ID=CAMNT_0007500771 /DNA_START=176 /DNA_END=655 /DNA_ORIENTATION=+